MVHDVVLVHRLGNAVVTLIYQNIIAPSFYGDFFSILITFISKCTNTFGVNPKGMNIFDFWCRDFFFDEAKKINKIKKSCASLNHSTVWTQILSIIFVLFAIHLKINFHSHIFIMTLTLF